MEWPPSHTPAAQNLADGEVRKRHKQIILLHERRHALDALQPGRRTIDCGDAGHFALVVEAQQRFDQRALAGTRVAHDSCVGSAAVRVQLVWIRTG